MVIGFSIFLLGYRAYNEFCNMQWVGGTNLKAFSALVIFKAYFINMISCLSATANIHLYFNFNPYIKIPMSHFTWIESIIEQNCCYFATDAKLFSSWFWSVIVFKRSKMAMAMVYLIDFLRDTVKPKTKRELFSSCISYFV